MVAHALAGVVARTLDQYRGTIEAGIRRAIPTDGPQEHLYRLVAEYPSRGGKLMRPTLCVVGAVIMGGEPEDAIGAATAIELLHNAFLVHDDIEDDSLTRRGEPTLHTKYGLARAVNAGDALSALALGTLAEKSASWPNEVGRQVLLEFAHLLRRSAEGQAVELGWTVDARADITEADYLAMVRDKTCWYSTIHPLRIGALIGSRGRAHVDQLVAFGFHLGTLFQLHDDLENLLAPADGYGKDAGADVIEGKMTLPVIHFLSTAAETERTELLARLGPHGKGSISARQSFVVERLKAHGSIGYVQTLATNIATCAAHEFGVCFAGRSRSNELDFLLGLVAELEMSCRGFG